MTPGVGAHRSPSRPVALDAMGGDDAPASTVAGALLARADGVPVVLVGDEARLRAELRAAGGMLDVVHAAGAVAMDEDPAIALRGKRDASIRVAAGLVAAGRATALVSAGSTGATLAASLLEIGRLPGVRRPVVGAVLPVAAPGRGTVLVDAGASADVQPEALVSYALMGIAHARVLGTAAPRVGLLNVGAEPGKGSAFAKAAFQALRSGLEAGTSHGSFAGNVEPKAVLAGAVDVVVADGFTGNVFLKAVEALGEASGAAAGPGAAVLLGCAGPVLVAHGDAGPPELAAALRTAHEVAAAGFVEQVRAELGALRAPEEVAGA